MTKKDLIMGQTIDADLEWIQLKEDMETSTEPAEETVRERIVRKTKESPLVPIGCLATVCALFYGLHSFKRGDKKMSQKMMRTRVFAQGFTLVVAVGSTIIAASKAQKNGNPDNQIEEQAQQ